MKKKREVLITIIPMPLFLYAYRFGCLAWICFAISMYLINPFFFALTIGVATFLGLAIPNRALILTTESLEMHRIFLISYFNEIKTYDLKNMVNIGYEKGEFSFIALFLELIQPTNTSFFWKSR